MARPRVLVTRRIPEPGPSLLQAACEVHIWPEALPPPRAALLEAVRGCHGLLSLLTDRIDAEVMDAAGPQLRVISNLAVGVDNIDLQAAARRGIAVGHTPGVLTEATADLTWALLLAAARRIVEGERYVRTGQWQTWDPLLLLGTDVYGATLGIIGFGRIGQAVARRAQGFGMRVLYHSRRTVAREVTAQAVDLPTLLRESDFISLHAPLTPATHHLINRDTIRLIKPGAILINTARGALVETAALLEALRAGHLAAAALDVTDPEPLPADHPLLALPNCIVVPHIGSASQQTRARMAEIAARNLLAGVHGAPLPHAVALPAPSAEEYP